MYMRGVWGVCVHVCVVAGCAGIGVCVLCEGCVGGICVCCDRYVCVVCVCVCVCVCTCHRAADLVTRKQNCESHFVVI